MKRIDSGNGDACPVDPEHGRMFFVSPDRQFCPHSAHLTNAIYLRDGVTPASQTAPDLARVQGRPTAQITAQ